MSEDHKDKNDFVFWEIIPNEKGKKPIIIIHEKELIDFCSKVLGFYNYIDHSGNYNLVKVTKNCIVEEARIEDLKHAVKNFIRGKKKEELVWTVFVMRDYLGKKNIQLIETLTELNFNVSTKNEAYFYFKNTVACISPGNRKLIAYEDFKGFVWKKQIKNRNFILCDDFGTAVFKKFLQNICGTEDRYKSLGTIIGYLLHPYKDPSLIRAVIFSDPDIDSTGEANGRTGKSLLVQALSHITSVVWKDGKHLRPNENFVFDDVRESDRILWIDDAGVDFNLDNLFAAITGDLRVTRKYKDSKTIPFHSSPKITITTNNIVLGPAGDSDAARRIEFHLTRYYSKDFSPKDDFKQLFYIDWDEKEWQLFDNLMLRAVSFYMENGIIEEPKTDIIEKKLRRSTSPEFPQFMDDNIELDNRHDKAILLDQFKKYAPENRNITGNTFKKWMDKWADARGYKVIHSKSNGKAYVLFTNPNENAYYGIGIDV